MVTEFHYQEDTNSKIEVEYFSLDEMRAQFTELLQSYRQYHLNRQETPQDQQEEEARAERAQVAEETLKAAFQAQLQQDAQTLLTQTESVLIDKLVAWTAGTVFANEKSDSRAFHVETFALVEECSLRLMRLASNQISSNESALWPFIRKIR